MSSPQPRAPTNTPTRHDATSPVNLDKVNNKFTTHDSIHQAQLALERHITETSNSRMSHPSLYESMVAAQLVNQRHTKGPVKSVKHGYQVQSLDKGQLSDSLHELPLDQNYLAQLRRDTRDAWPKIHEGIRAEEEYYQTLLTQIGPDQAGVDYAGFATLSRVYGPVKIKEPLPKISQGIWVEEYKALYAKFPGSDEELLATMAKAYLLTKLILRVEDSEGEGVDGVSTESSGNDPAVRSDIDDLDNKAGRDADASGRRIHWGPYDEVDDEVHYDFADFKTAGYEDDYVDNDDDVLGEQRGRQGYGGWD